MAEKKLFWQYNTQNDGGISYISCPKCGFKIDCRRFVIGSAIGLDPKSLKMPFERGFEECPQCKSPISSDNLNYDKVYDDAISQEELKYDDF